VLRGRWRAQAFTSRRVAQCGWTRPDRRGRSGPARASNPRTQLRPARRSTSLRFSTPGFRPLAAPLTAPNGIRELQRQRRYPRALVSSPQLNHPPGADGTLMDISDIRRRPPSGVGRSASFDLRLLVDGEDCLWPPAGSFVEAWMSIPESAHEVQHPVLLAVIDPLVAHGKQGTGGLVQIKSPGSGDRAS
jgi:hypothetical protein